MKKRNNLINIISGDEIEETYGKNVETIIKYYMKI